MAESFIALPPDGAGKKLHTEEMSNGLHNQVFTLGDPKNIENLQNIDEYGSAFFRFAEGNQIFDGFGKTKVSQETLIGEYTPTYGIENNMQFTVNGTASNTFLPDESSIKLSIGSVSGDSVKMTSNKYHKFFPGTSQLIEITLSVGDFGKENVNRYWGYYDNKDGIILVMRGTEFGVIQRSSVSGSVVDTFIPQSSFNIDKADGTGISKVAMDPSKVNTYWIDYQWSGRIRIGGYSDEGTRTVFHEIQNSNSASSLSMKRCSLPVRVEQFNSGISISSSEMKFISAVVYAESNNLDFKGDCYSTASFDGTPISPMVITGNVFSTSVSIRPKANFNGKINRNAIIPSVLMVQTDKVLQLSIMSNITLDGSETWVSVSSLSSAEKTRGVIVDLGNQESHYCSMIPDGTSMIDLSNSFSYLRRFLKNNADGSQPTYSIVFRSLDGTPASVVAGMTWTELVI